MLLKHKLKQWFAVTLLCAAPFSASLAAQTAQGISPRLAAKDYAVRASHENIQIGASLLTKKDLKKAFFRDLSQCCVVVEIAFYPATKNDFVNISLDHFVLRESSEDRGIQPSSAEVVAARLQNPPKPTYPSRGPDITTTSEIGYGRASGNNRQDPSDPNNRTGVYERAGVGVGFPGGERQQGSPGTTAGNRKVSEDELTAKGLPEISANEPVAGYLYFTVSNKKKSYELVYTVDGKQIVLALK